MTKKTLPTDDALIERFLEMMVAERGASKNTLLSYSKDLREIAIFLKSKNNFFLKATSSDYKDFLSTLYKLKYSSNSLARYKSCLNQFYLFLMTEGYVETNPCSQLESIKIKRPLPKNLSEEEILLLLDDKYFTPDPEDIRLKALLEILYSTGLRVSELVTLKLSDIDPSLDFILVLGKGNKERLVPLSEKAKETYKKYLDIRDLFCLSSTQSYWVFPDGKKGKSLSRQKFALMLKKHAEKIGLAPEKISPHIIRHAFATHLLDNGADLRSLQTLLGHSDISTTQIYTHIAQKKLKDTVYTYHPLAPDFNEKE